MTYKEILKDLERRVADRGLKLERNDRSTNMNPSREDEGGYLGSVFYDIKVPLAENIEFYIAQSALVNNENSEGQKRDFENNPGIYPLENMLPSLEFEITLNIHYSTPNDSELIDLRIATDGSIESDHEMLYDITEYGPAFEKILDMALNN